MDKFDIYRKGLSLLLVAGLSLLNFRQVNSQNKVVERKIEFNQSLADELNTMAETDQIAAYIPQGKYKQWPVEKWESFKDSVFTTHKKRLEKIFEKFGYPGYSLVGEKGSQNFWLMIQHCDSDPAFQSRVLEKLKIEVDNKNADGSNYGLLTDRVKINTGEKQVYGTQVSYNSLGQAYPKNLVDSVNVNKRRAEVGLEPIEEYLNLMTQMHFEMNKEYLKSKGITKPILYNTND
jgi:hypothetical protein